MVGRGKVHNAVRGSQELPPSLMHPHPEADGSNRSTMYQDLKNSRLDDCQRYVEEIVGALIKHMKLPLSQRDEFISAGMLGLVEAAHRYVPEKGVEFKAFAYLRVRGAIIDYIRSICVVNGTAYRLLKAIEASQALHEAAEDRARRNGDESHGGKLERVIDFLTKSAASYKLVAIAQGAQDTAERADAGSPEDSLAHKREREKIRHCLATLSEKERLIIEQFYFNDVSFTDVAQAHAGLSKSWVSRLHDKAITKLRNAYLESSTPHDLEAMEGCANTDGDGGKSSSPRRVSRASRSRSH